MEEAAAILKTKLSGKTCKAMTGLIEKGKEVLENGTEAAVVDATPIASDQ